MQENVKVIIYPCVRLGDVFTPTRQKAESLQMHNVNQHEQNQTGVNVMFKH